MAFKDDLIKDIINNLAFDNTEFVKGIVDFIENELSEEELIAIEPVWGNMQDVPLNTIAEFNEAYQPIFDIAGVDLNEMYAIAKKRKDARTLNYDKL